MVQTFHAVSLSCDINMGKNQSDCTNSQVFKNYFYFSAKDASEVFHRAQHTQQAKQQMAGFFVGIYVGVSFILVLKMINECRCSGCLS